ncbi:MAG: CapA family protein [Clostridia bacterium]|nr:CapA family protein [Clostridia bacterium]
MFNTPETILDALKAAGFDVLTMANNHCLDRYCDGLIASVENVRKTGFLETGAYTSQEDYDTILFLEKDDIRVALFAYTDSVNRMESHVDQTKLPYVVRRYTRERAVEDIKRAKAEGADAVILSIHWGKEYLREPENYKKEDAKALAEAGADVIIGSHPHVLQPVEKIRVTREDGSIKDVLVAYSMGNFLSNQREQYTDTGMMINFSLEKDFKTGHVEVKNTSYTPTWVWRFEKGSNYDYRILPLPESLESEPRGISSENLKRMRNAWKEAKELIGENIIPVA